MATPLSIESGGILVKRIRYETLVSVVTIFAFVTFCLGSPSFRGTTNLQNLMFPIALLGIVALGVGVCMMAGVLDLSVGSIMGVSGVFAAGLTSQTEVPTALALLIALCLGTGLGLVNGAMATRLAVPSFIVTLGTLAVYRALALRLHEGFFGGQASILIRDPAFAWLGQTSAGQWMPVSLLVMMGLAVGLAYFLSRSTYGLWVYAVGGNPSAAYAAGISNQRIQTMAFVFSGFCAALGGVMLASRSQGSIPFGGNGWEFEAITAVVIGGTSLFGGAGSAAGVVLGVALLTILSSGMSHLGVSFYDQYLIRGSLLVAVLWFDTKVRRIKGTRP